MGKVNDLIRSIKRFYHRHFNGKIQYADYWSYEPEENIIRIKQPEDPDILLSEILKEAMDIIFGIYGMEVFILTRYIIYISKTKEKMMSKNKWRGERVMVLDKLQVQILKLYLVQIIIYKIKSISRTNSSESMRDILSKIIEGNVEIHTR